jgi:D-serine deaminase-like pyridoxal phosphate-dependent protein
MHSIFKPTLVIDKTKCLNNIGIMVGKAKGLGIPLRPHFKTHQSLEVGQWFRAYGIDRIAVSSVPMANYFATDGWDDITIALPFVPQQSSAADELAKRVNLTILASTVNAAYEISQRISGNINVMLEIDTGHGRSGFNPLDSNGIEAAIHHIVTNENITFTGFLTHAGHSYRAHPIEIEELNLRAFAFVVDLKRRWIERFPSISASYGDTPTSVLANSFEGIDELRPGNFVFFDMQQASRGVCNTSSIAVALVCPVIAVSADECKAVIWGGAVHLSKDSFLQPDGKISFGAVCNVISDLSWSSPIDGLYLESVSQEHGVIRAKNSQLLRNLKEGDLVAILPAHSCLTADTMGEYFVIGQGIVESFRKRMLY